MIEKSGKICAIIPAYNAEATIEKVISGIACYLPRKHIIVINDGSRDNTAQKAVAAGAVLLNNSRNRGKGFSLKKGFQFAIENKFEAVICLDADLQHDPDDLPNFFSCYQQTDADIILGSRMKDIRDMPLDRQFSNQTTSLLISLLTGIRVRDSQTGYRLIKTNVLRKITLHSNRYETESEFLVKALKRQFRIEHVPIKTIYNQQPSHIRRFQDTLRFVVVVLKSLIEPD